MLIIAEKMNPIISIIIINYNTLDLTSRCISSIYENNTVNNIEIIVVDNASNREPIDPLIVKHPEIKLIKSDRNLGFAGGNNLGISYAKGKYILLLNSDTEIRNDAIQIAYNIIQSQRNIGVITGQLLNPDGTIQPQAGRFPSLKHEFKELLRLNKLLSPHKRSQEYLGTECNYNTPIYADWVWGAFFMFKKDDLNHFPEKKLHDNFFMYGEDMQWCYYFRKKLKKRVLVHPEPKILHLVGGSDIEKEKGFVRYCKKMLPNQYAWIKLEKGLLYTRAYYFTKALLYRSLRDNKEVNNAKYKVFISLAMYGTIHIK